MNAIPELLGVAVIFGTLITGVILFVRTLTTYYLRKKMVDKGYVDKDSIAILQSKEKDESRMSTLKWGLVIFFAGLALIILDFVDADPESPLPYGIFIVSISAGLLIHYYISGNLLNKDKV